MATDCGLIEFAKANLLNLCDISMILNLSCVLHMLKYINSLMQFVKTKDVVYDYVANVKTCQANLYKIYGDLNTSFQVTQNFS
jgi:hypothetical protein